MNPLIRSTTLFALFALALTAQAKLAFSNLDPAPDIYSNGGDQLTSGRQYGYQFTTTASGILSGFNLAITDETGGGADPGPHGHSPFTVSLYTDNGSDHPDQLLGTWNGLSPNLGHSVTTDVLTHITATGPEIDLSNNTRYWLIATGVGNTIYWNRAAQLSPTNVYFNDSVERIDPGQSGAFSVELVGPTAAPAPAALLPFAFGLAGKLRKRRKA